MSVLFPSNDSRQFRSYRAGREFGKLFWQYKPLLNTVSLERIAGTLRLSSTYDRECYITGFILGYIEVSGNYLPDYTRKKEQELMSKVHQVKKEVQTTSVSQFASAAQLAQNVTSFCITSIGQRQGKYGQEWVLQILVNPIDLDVFDTDENIKQTLTFACGSGNSRDRLLEALKDETPVHNAFLVSHPTSRGNAYIDLDGRDGVCVCGVEEREETVEQPTTSRF